MVRQMPIKTGCEMISSHSGIVTEATSTLSNQQKVTKQRAESNEQGTTSKKFSLDFCEGKRWINFEKDTFLF